MQGVLPKVLGGNWEEEESEKGEAAGGGCSPCNTSTVCSICTLISKLSDTIGTNSCVSLHVITRCSVEHWTRALTALG